MPKSYSGATAVILKDGVEIGFATDVSASETITQMPVEVLGDIDVKEHVAVRRMVTLAASFVRIKNKSLKAQDAWPRGETLDVTEFPEMTWQLFDIATDTPIATITGVVAETREWRVDAGSIITENGSFRGRRMFDEIDS